MKWAVAGPRPSPRVVVGVVWPTNFVDLFKGFFDGGMIAQPRCSFVESSDGSALTTGAIV